MTQDSVVVLPDILVIFTLGEWGRPISVQAPEAFRRLEAPLASLRGRRFYGAKMNGEYRACVTIIADDTADRLPRPTWTLPGGRYARRRIAHWEANLHLIAPAFQALRQREDFDNTRPCIEYYRSQRELLVMAPVR